jgi:molybdopterin/thiamine biosynthesis adenylyltransferase
MLHYADLIEAQAGVIEPGVTARTRKEFAVDDSSSVFKYEDMASVRASIVAVTDKLRSEKIGLVGLGGTGSYILDLVAKTPVQEIHLFDGDQFETHNAFRAPGAASLDDLQRKLAKVEYFAERYAPMRNGLVSHCCLITEDNLCLLDEMDFVFVAVDSGPARRLICQHLQKAGIPFIDVGMDLQMNHEAIGLHGMFRVTLSTPERQEHFFECVPTYDGPDEDLYRSNIQVADMNMCNAAHAVICWKQYRRFYLEHKRSHNRVYTLFDQRLHLDVIDKEIQE